MGETTLHVAIMSVCVVLINGPFLLCQCGANLDCAALFEVPPPHTHTHNSDPHRENGLYLAQIRGEEINKYNRRSCLLCVSARTSDSVKLFEQRGSHRKGRKVTSS